MSGRSLRRLAVLVGALSILVGVAALVGDPDAAANSGRTGLYLRALRGLREAFGDPGGGFAMIVTGLLLGGLMFWAAGRRR